jgi:hypothetical protein
MSRTRKARVCPICIHRNPPHLTECEHCREDLSRVPAQTVQAGTGRPQRAVFGVPERATLGLAAGAFAGLLLASAPLVGYVSDEYIFAAAVTQGSGLVLMVVLGLVGACLAVLTAREGGIQALLSLDGSRRRPCPYCAEMIQAQAVVCRYCNRSVAA